MSRNLGLAACGLALLISACAATGTRSERNVIGSWQVRSVEGRDAAAEPASDITFTADGKVSGRAGCNRFTSSYTVFGDTLQMGQPGVTRMMCDPAVMERESRFLKAIGTVERFAFEGDTLLLFSKGVTEPVRLVAAPSP